MRIGPVTLYSLRCAMHGAVNIDTRWGYLCLKPPTKAWGKWWPWYVYLSPNATPWGATFIVGPEYSRTEKKLSRLRRALWGHGYDPDAHDPQELSAYTDSFADDLPTPSGGEQ